MLKTSCKKCIFAKYENNIQTGCAADRLDKFDSKNFISDEGQSYYIINRFCNLCHQQNWADHLKEKNGGFDFTEQQLLNLAKFEAVPKVHTIVLLDNLEYDEIYHIVEELMMGEYYPASIWFYQTSEKFEFTEINDLCSQFFLYECEVRYGLHTGEIKNLYNQLDDYYCFINKVSAIDYIVEELNIEINENLKQCLFIQDKNWTLIYSHLFKLLPAKFTITDNDVIIETYNRDKLIIQEKDFTKFNEYVNKYIELHSNNPKP